MGKLAIFFFRNICFVDRTEFFHLEIKILAIEILINKNKNFLYSFKIQGLTTE